MEKTLGQAVLFRNITLDHKTVEQHRNQSLVRERKCSEPDYSCLYKTRSKRF